MKLSACLALLTLILPALLDAAPIERMWLSHKTSDPGKLVVNWTTDQPGDSVVHFGTTADYGHTVQVDESTTLHQVEIPIPQRHVTYHYAVQTGDHKSADATFKGYPQDTLRLAVVADWQSKKDLSAVRKDDIHLLLSAGDNIARLWDACGEGEKSCVKPYEALIDAYPELFRSTPFLPALGNHDREIRPRGPKPPDVPVYDIDATAFRRFFELPGDEWKWHFDVPEFGLRLIALDFNHTSDFGTTWQTCHPFDATSEQFLWYRDLMQDPPRRVVTLYNERNATMRGTTGGEWKKLFEKGTLCVTGFGYFAERAEVDGFPYYNTAMSGKGDRYPDPHSKFLASEDSYVLITLHRAGPMIVEIKSLEGQVLDRQEY